MKSWERWLKAGTREPGDLLPATSHPANRVGRGCSEACKGRIASAYMAKRTMRRCADGLDVRRRLFFVFFHTFFRMPFGIARAWPFWRTRPAFKFVFLLADRARPACRHAAGPTRRPPDTATAPAGRARPRRGVAEQARAPPSIGIGQHGSGENTRAPPPPPLFRRPRARQAWTEAAPTTPLNTNRVAEERQPARPDTGARRPRPSRSSTSR